MFPQGQSELTPDEAAPWVGLIDYNDPIVWEKTHLGLLSDQDPEARIPPNSMEKYREESLLEVLEPVVFGWYPKDSLSRPKLRQEWLDKFFGRSNAAQFVLYGVTFVTVVFIAPKPIGKSFGTVSHGESFKHRSVSIIICWIVFRCRMKYFHKGETYRRLRVEISQINYS